MTAPSGDPPAAERPATREARRGRVDGLEGAYVVGWAMPGADGATRTVTVTDGDGRVLASARAARFRADLLSLGLAAADFAFRIPVADLHDAGLLHVLSDGVELDGSPLALGDALFDSDMTVSAGAVTGWILPRARGAEPPPLVVTAPDGRVVARARPVRSTGEDPLFSPWRYRAPLDQSCFGGNGVTLACAVGGRVLAHLPARLRVGGTLETVTAERCIGWLMSPDAPRRRFRIEIRRDDGTVVRAACGVARPDVLDAFPDLVDDRVGFDVALPPPADPTRPSTLRIGLEGAPGELFESPYVAARPPALIECVRRGARLVRANAELLGDDAVALLGAVLSAAIAGHRIGPPAGLSMPIGRTVAAEADPTEVTVVIPVFRDVAVTEACLASVLAHRDAARHRVLIVDDRSPEAAMAPMLARAAAAPNVVLIENGTNLGFIRSVNAALSHPDRRGHVLLLNSDTRVFEGWLDGMCAALAASPATGTVTALSNNATIFSYPHQALRGPALPDIGTEELAAIARRRNAGLRIEVPTGHGFCLLIRDEVVRLVGGLDEGFGRGYGEENDLCARAADLGFNHVAAADVLVEHRESVSFTGDKSALLARNLRILEERYPEYGPTIAAFEREDGLRRARWAIDAERLRRSGEARAFVVTVSNALTGGTAKAVEETAAAAGLDRYGRILVRAVGEGAVELSCPDPPVRARFCGDETDILADLLASLPVALLAVHQTLGFDSRFLERLGSLARGLNAAFYAHDYYPACPRVTMIDANGAFCDLAAPETCVRCVAMGGVHEAAVEARHAAPEASVLEHRARFDRLLAAFRAVVAPSEAAAAYLRRAFPDRAVEAIPHPETVAMPPGPRGGDSSDIVLLGALGPHKGSRALLEIARHASISRPDLTFHVIGHTDIDDALLAVGNVRITGRYAPDELPALLAAAGGRYALFLQAWPETYGYTLTEAVAHGLIPLVPDIGAPAERVRAAGYGHVFGFPVDPGAVLRLLDGLASGAIPDGDGSGGPGRLAALSDTAQRTRATLLPGDRARPPAARPVSPPGGSAARRARA